jgi:twitching motility protein PilT
MTLLMTEEHFPTLPSAKRELDELLKLMDERGASDLHITAGSAARIRVNGSLAPIEGRPKLSPNDTDMLIRSILSASVWEKFEATQELDTAYTIPGVSRFRVNVYQQRGAVGAVFRSIPHRIRSLSELEVPESVERFAKLQRGLVLVTGPTGSGKSTTLAGVIDKANQTRASHIVTIEDPIEYLHRHAKSLVNQREVGSDTADFATALREVLRQDPDIILVGELRDLETTQVAVTAAETGHLVFATLHTQSAAQTVERMVDIFPVEQQQQIRSQVANCLAGVVTQALVPRSDGKGRVVVCEIMIATAAIRNLIREGRPHQIRSFLQSSRDLGMISFDQHLAQRFQEDLISMNTALEIAHDPNEFRRLARI